MTMRVKPWLCLLGPEQLPVEPSGVSGHKNHKTINPSSQYWFIAKEHGHKQRLGW